MKAVLALLLGVATAWNKEYTLDEVHQLNKLDVFKQWANEFDRTYANLAEESDHFMIWLDNLYTIADTNSQDLTYKLALNQFSDMTGDQFRHYVHGDHGACYRPEEREHIMRVGESSSSDSSSSDSSSSEDDVTGPLADSVDWTTKGVVTPVKNQGQCGSCWAFSATGAIECQYAIKNGKLNSLSEQQLVDCAGSRYGCAGCNGGQMTGAMKYAADDGGLCSESEYSYTGRNGQCKSSSCGTKYDKNSGYKGVTPYSSSALVTATNAGCISIGIEADQTAFQHYSSGVLTGSCGTRIDHGVLVVGYGTSGSQEYWKVKNSWGKTWGMQGYILICRDCNKNGRDGECGILMEPNIPTF